MIIDLKQRVNELTNTASDINEHFPPIKNGVYITLKQ